MTHIRQNKLEPRALKCIMLGYQPGVKGYRLWSIGPGNHKLIISRDVKFVEDRMPFTETKQSHGQRSDNNGDKIEVEMPVVEKDDGQN